MMNRGHPSGTLIVDTVIRRRKPDVQEHGVLLAHALLKVGVFITAGPIIRLCAMLGGKKLQL
jgi:hypothetical protein